MKIAQMHTVYLNCLTLSLANNPAVLCVKPFSSLDPCLSTNDIRDLWFSWRCLWTLPLEAR